MHRRMPFNRDWWFKPTFTEQDITGAAGLSGFEPVELPHTCKELPFNYIDETDYQLVSCYTKRFCLPEGSAGKRIALWFEGVMLEARVYCNGVEVCAHKGGYTPFEADLTGAVRPQGENLLVVRVDSTERADIPPYGNVVDYLTFGGIYREVDLYVSELTRIGRLWPRPAEILKPEKQLLAEAELISETPCEALLTLTLTGPQNEPVAKADKKICLRGGRQKETLELEGLCGIRLWEMDDPALYQATVSLEWPGGRDEAHCRFGFREARFEPEGFTLNGKPQKIIGLNRHQSYPYVGYAMPKRVQYKDAELLKNEFGVNLVRTSHYPQSRHFLDRCDELGLLVIEEIPGWQHIGGEAWQALALQDLEDMILRDRCHPSIVLWGVRINESQDAHDFYTRTNELAHRLDPTRQTGGTRYIQKSELLEDVYTYNDFTDAGSGPAFRPQAETTGLDRQVPLLVTECVGHTFPTKSFDHESRRVEHALRHLRGIDAALGRPDLAGMVGWCAFDYNSHGCFGSGDKVCYHGVADMNRVPKYAAFAYASQREPQRGPVLEPATVAARGERNGGGIVPFLVFTNCDFVRVYKNEALVDDFYPDRAGFPHLPHPPVVVSHLLEQTVELGFAPEDMDAFKKFLTRQALGGQLPNLDRESAAYLQRLGEKYGVSTKALYSVVVKMGGGWGDAENNFRLEGYVKGRLLCSRRIGEHKSMAGLILQPDDLRLCAGGETYDATRVVIRAQDSFGEVMPYVQECVQVTVEGPARLLGPTRFPLVGGTAAFWVRTLNEPGRVRLRAEGIYGTAECVLQVE